MNNVEPYIAAYDTVLMTDVWESSAEFLKDYKHVGIPTTISDPNATTLFYLLYAKYGNNPIANYDITQFKYKVFSVIFQHGPTWEKKLAVQETLRGLQLSDLLDDGSFHELFNHTGAENSSKTGTDGNTRTYQEADTNTGTQTLARTGTDTTNSTGTQALARTGTDTVASTGTSTVAHTGTIGVIHDNDVQNSGSDTTVNNHAFNPGTAPSGSDPYAALNFVNEQNAQKATKGTKSEQDESSTTTYNNTDTTTNNLQNQTTHATTDTTTNNLQNQTTHATTDTTTNNLTNAKSGNITDSRTISDSVANQDVANNETTRTISQGKLKAYEHLLSLLDSNFTDEFINKFKYCFKQFILPEKQLLYVYDNDEE